MSIFVNVHKVENVNGGGVGGQKSPKLVNVVCERPLTLIVPDPQVPSNIVGTSPCSKQLLDFPCSDPYEKQCPE